MLTHGIMPVVCNNKSEASQIAGRLKGNQKNWSNYKAPYVYCTEKFNKIATEVEHKTISLAKIAYEENWEKLTLDMFKTVEKKWYYYEPKINFDTYKDALIYLKSQEHHLKPNNSSKEVINIRKMSKRNPCKRVGNDENGYVLTTKLIKKNKILQNIDNVADNRLTLDKLSKISLGSNISKPDALTASYIIYPVYENMDSLPNEVKYFVRHTMKRE
tara:strand:- start:196 stop:843 length:648 start_codon:yes stop_codon:yes gene_type:complete